MGERDQEKKQTTDKTSRGGNTVTVATLAGYKLTSLLVSFLSRDSSTSEPYGIAPLYIRLYGWKDRFDSRLSIVRLTVLHSTYTCQPATSMGTLTAIRFTLVQHSLAQPPTSPPSFVIRSLHRIILPDPSAGPTA